MPRPYNPQQEMRKKKDRDDASSFKKIYGFPFEELLVYKDKETGEMKRHVMNELDNENQEELEKIKKELGLSIQEPIVEHDMFQEILTEFNQLKNTSVDTSDMDILTEILLLKFDYIDELADKSRNFILSLCYHFIINHKANEAAAKDKAATIVLSTVNSTKESIAKAKKEADAAKEAVVEATEDTKVYKESVYKVKEKALVDAIAKASSDINATKSKVYKEAEGTNLIINDMFGTLTFENKILAIVYELNEPDNVLLMNELYKTWPLFENELQPLLEKKEVENIKKVINDYTIDKNKEYVWALLDTFLVKWSTKRFIQLQGLLDDIILQTLRDELSWIKSFTDDTNDIKLNKVNHIVFNDKNVEHEEHEEKVEHGEHEEHDQLELKYINRLRYFPKVPVSLSLLNIEKYLYNAKTPFLIKNGEKIYFPFSQVTPLSAKSLKSFLLKVINMVGHKTNLEAKLQPYLSEEDIIKMYQSNLSTSLEDGLDKVYDLLKTDAEIIKQINESEAIACKKEAIRINIVKTGLQRRAERNLKTSRHYEDKKDKSFEVYEECKKISSNVVIRLDIPDDHDVYLESPVQDSLGNNYYKPKLSLQNELCSRETILKEGQDGIWTEDGTQYLLAKYINGEVVPFTEVDYHSLFPIQQISLSYKYTEINEVHKHIIHDTLYNKFTNKQEFTLLYNKLTSSPISMLQLLYIFYCIIVFNDETFQLYDKTLFTSFQERINGLIDSIANDGVIYNFFNEMLYLSDTSLSGNGKYILTYITLFINKCIKETFPFFVMRNDKYPCLPIFINVSMIKNLPESDKNPIPPAMPYLQVSINPSAFQGNKKRHISKIILCECGSNESTIPTIRFNEEGLPYRVRVCKSCLENFSVA